MRYAVFSEIAHTVGELKSFKDQTLANRLTPEWMARCIAAWQYKRNVDECYGHAAYLPPLRFEYEQYKRGFHDDESGVSLGKGESCLILHLTERLDLRYSGTLRETTPALLHDAIIALRFVSTLMNSLEMRQRPKYVAGLTNKAVARAAMRLGFGMWPAPRHLVSAYHKYVWDNDYEGSSNHWLVAMETPLLQQLYPPLPKEEINSKIQLQLKIALQSIVQKDK